VIEKHLGLLWGPAPADGALSPHAELVIGKTELSVVDPKTKLELPTSATQRSFRVFLFAFLAIVAGSGPRAIDAPLAVI
jgi:hypothetical protein